MRCGAILLVIAASLAPRAAAAQPTESPPDAAPPDSAVCLDAFGAAQRLRREGKLIDSAAELGRCGAASCPAAIVTKCVGWLAEVRAATPSIVIGVRAEPGGADLADAEIVLDGVRRAHDGRPIELDPGTHELRVEHRGRSATQLLVLREGERLRGVEIVLAPPAPAPHATSTPAETTTAPRRDPGLSPLVFIGFGLAVVATGVGIGTGVAALGEASALEEACGGLRCDDAQRDEYRDGVTLANVSTGAFIFAGVGAALGGVGIALTVIDGGETSARVGPGGATVRGRF